MTAASAIAHLASAGQLVAAKKFVDAELALQRALEMAPGDAKALTLLALVRYKLGRLDEARATYRQLVRAAPNDADARRNLGLLALKLGHLDEAQPELEMAVRLAPQDARAWSYLGYAFAKRGEAVAAAAAFRRAGQDALAGELEQAAKTQRPAMLRGGGTLTGAPAPELARLGSGLSRPVALAPPLPPLVGEPTAIGRRRRATQPAVPPATPLAEADLRQRVPLGSVPAQAQPVLDQTGTLGGFLGPPATTPLGKAQLRQRDSIEPPADLPGRAEAEPAPLLAYVRGRLGPAPALPATRGALRLPVADEVYARADAVLAGTGTLRWERGVRRSQGRFTTEPLGASPAVPFFRLTGAGAVWVAGPPDRWMALRLTDDVLYVREDRLLAFEGALAWESGSVKDTGVPMLQFRGRGLLALEVPRDPIAIEVVGDAQTLVSAGRLYGWVGRLVPHAAAIRGTAPFQLVCEGEGIVLLEAAG